MDRGAAVGRQNICGFEYGNGTLVNVTRWRNPSGQYWVTPRVPNAYGFYAEEESWLLYRESTGQANLALYDCVVPGTQDHFISSDNRCEGQMPMGMY